MNGEALSFDPAIWEAVLGPRPDSSGGYSPFESASWPDEDVGPVDGVFWLRWIVAHLVKLGATAQAAKTLRLTLRQRLQAGELKAVAVHPETGRTRSVPTESWQATGNRGRVLWWSGLYGVHVGEGSYIPCDVYLIEAQPKVPPPPPAWWPGPEEPLKKWCAPAGEAEDEARSRLTARSAAVSDRAICRELSEMWQEAGRTGGKAGTMNTTRRNLR